MTQAIYVRHSNPSWARVTWDRWSLVADLASGLWSRGAGLLLPASLPTLVGFCGISFLLSVKYVHFMEQNFALDLFPPQHSCNYLFFSLLSASLLVHSLECTVSTFPCLVWQLSCKNLHAVDRNMLS